MNAFENAKKFFDACEALEGWAGCKQYVVDDAPFVAQSEPLVDINTVEGFEELAKKIEEVSEDPVVRIRARRWL